MIAKVINKIDYLRSLYSRNRVARKFCGRHQVQLYNWSRPFEQDMWLIDFIEKRLAKRKQTQESSVVQRVWS